MNNAGRKWPARFCLILTVTWICFRFGPAHREVIPDCYDRIAELKEHHQRRLNNILDIMLDETMNTAQIASKIDWDLDTKDWGKFPAAQKIFATGEALSPLSHLVFKGVLGKELRAGEVYYQRK